MEKDEQGAVEEGPIDNEPIDKDMPCIDCQYNLRGLRPSGRCPECGARVRDTLDVALIEVVHDEPPISDEPIDEDMPCLGCGQNLRGLRPAEKCPKCGQAIARTVEFVSQRVLCPTCMEPQHPSAPNCANCGSPLQGAAGVAAYYRTTPIAPTPRVSHEAKTDDDEPLEPPTRIFVILGWLLGAPPIGLTIAALAASWADELDHYGTTAGDLIVGGLLSLLALAAIGLIPALIILIPTRRYVRRKKEYLDSLKARNLAAQEPANEPAQS